MKETGNSEKRMDFEILGCLGFKPNGVGHIKRRNSATHSHTGGNQLETWHILGQTLEANNYND